jgi:hypothetical protein
MQNRSSERADAESAETLSIITVRCHCSSRSFQVSQSACMTNSDCLDQDLTKRCGHRVACISAMQLFMRSASSFPRDRALPYHHMLQISTITVHASSGRIGCGRKPALRKPDKPVPVSVIVTSIENALGYVVRRERWGSPIGCETSCTDRNDSAHILVPLIHASSN